MTHETTTADPVLPEVKMNLVPVREPVTGRVVSNDLCLKGKANSFVRHTEIDVSGTPLAGNFLVGQSFGVITPGVDERGKPHKECRATHPSRLPAPIAQTRQRETTRRTEKQASAFFWRITLAV